MATASPLLCAAGVSLLCSNICRLLPSSGITRLRWYYEAIRLPAAVLPSSLWAVVGHTLGLSPLIALNCFSESSGRVSRVAVQSLCHACHGLRPRGSDHHLTLAVMPVLTSAHFDAVILPVDLITGLYPFNLSAYGLHARCPTHKVGDYSPPSKDLLPGGWLAFRGGVRSHLTPRPCPVASAFASSR